jgi:predicted phosphatase
MNLKDIKLSDTIFDDYSTCVFDLDGTILDCFTPQGDSIGCYATNPPFTLKAANVLSDVDGNIVKLDAGVRDLFKFLDRNNINIGIVSSGEKEDTPFEAQPAMFILKKFELKKYINYEIVFKRDMDKADYVKPLGKTLFIDNEDKNLEDVDKKGQVDVLNRGSFENWTDLLQQKYASLNLAFLKLGNLEDSDPINHALTFYKDTMDYSELKLKQSCGEFISPKELKKLARLSRDLPREMVKLADIIETRYKNIDTTVIKAAAWNEDNWPYCFNKLDKFVDVIGI